MCCCVCVLQSTRGHWYTQCLCYPSGRAVWRWTCPQSWGNGLKKPSPSRRPHPLCVRRISRPCSGLSKVSRSAGMFHMDLYVCCWCFVKINSVCVSSSCLGDTLSQAVDFLPLLIQTVEKAAAQNTQHALLAEGVTASVLLCRLSVLDSVSGERSH